MLKKFGLSLALLFLLVAPALAQNPGVTRQGAVSANDCVSWASNTQIKSAGGPCATNDVTSVFGRTGAVVAATNDYNFNQLAGSVACSQMPALTGDVTSSAGACATVAPFVQDGTGAVTITLSKNDKQSLNVFQFIPEALWAAIKNDTSTTAVDTYLQAAIDAGYSTGKGVYFPCGRFIIANPLTYRSNAYLHGDGRCTRIRPNSSLAIPTQWSALWPAYPSSFALMPFDFAAGATQVTIRDLFFDGTDVPTGGGIHGTHLVLAYNSSHILIDNISCLGQDNGASNKAGSCVAALNSSYINVVNSYGYGLGSACWNFWQGSSKSLVRGNLCEGSVANQAAVENSCVLTTGSATDGTAASVSNIVVVGNVCRSLRFGIWVQGGAGGGFADQISVANNDISNILVSHAIRTSEARRALVTGNVARTVAGLGIASVQESTSACADCIFTNNDLSDLNTAGGSSGIGLGANTLRSLVAANVVASAAVTYPIDIASGADNNQIRGNILTTGATGRISNAGTGNTVADCENATKACAFELVPAPAFPQGRLTLASGTPVMASSQSAKTTIYYTPYVGRLVPIYDTALAAFRLVDIAAELSNATAQSSTGNAGPAAVGNNLNYDLCISLATGSPVLSRLAAWTDATTRSAALTTIAGIIVNNAQITISGGTNIPANTCTYVGTVRSNGSAQIDYTFGSSAAGGGAAYFYVYNQYNRVSVSTQVVDSNSSWSSTAAAWEALDVGGTGSGLNNRVSFVIGGLVNEDSVNAYLLSNLFASVAGQPAGIGVTFDASSGTPCGAWGGVNNSIITLITARCTSNPGIGYHYAQALQYGPAGGATFYGRPGGSFIGSAFFADLRL